LTAHYFFNWGLCKNGIVIIFLEIHTHTIKNK
jgi:hypothetical protein